MPGREFETGRKNIYGGKIRFFWNAGRPLILGDAACLVLHKVGAMGVGFFAQSEGAFLKSKNILAERDPEKITFETLPEGDIGLREPPAYMTYAPGGPRVKHPSAANFAWRCGNGKFLYWFHNHGGPFISKLVSDSETGVSPYFDRNPAWLMAGEERDTPQGSILVWSQPEILLYDDDPLGVATLSTSQTTRNRSLGYFVSRSAPTRSSA